VLARGEDFAPMSRRYWIVPATIALLAFGGLINVAGADSRSPTGNTRTPNVFTNYVGSTSITYDSEGTPVQASLKLSGLPQSSGFKLCIDVVPETKPSYNDFNYGIKCKTFSFSNSSSTSVTWGTNFAWGGPAEYRAAWSVPPTADAVTTSTFKWAFKNSSTLSPCPPDPYLQKGVWQPSRHLIEHRCYTFKGPVAANYTSGANDGDWNWKIDMGEKNRLVEYMIRDKGRLRGTCSFDCSMPTLHEVWELTGVFVCDTNHGHREFHPVFQASEYSGTTVVRTLLSGPQYSTTIWGGPYPTFDPIPC
jgi:hypothetical protein